MRDAEHTIRSIVWDGSRELAQAPVADASPAVAARLITTSSIGLGGVSRPVVTGGP
jgi:hypothetical protein